VCKFIKVPSSSLDIFHVHFCVAQFSNSEQCVVHLAVGENTLRQIECSFYKTLLLNPVYSYCRSPANGYCHSFTVKGIMDSWLQLYSQK
jgi:hypothetical protein